MPWKMYPMLLRTCTTLRRGARCSSWPRTRRLPSCSERSPPIRLSRVVFPEPDAGHDHDLAGRISVSRRTGSACAARRCEVVIDLLDRDDRCFRIRASEDSAGSAERSLRTATSRKRRT